MRSIGEQLGREVAPQSELAVKPIPSEKPGDISSEEVDAWLQVFHDPVESSVPELKLTKKTVKPQRPKNPVVRKQGDLTQDEVSVWLDVFPEPDIDAKPGETSGVPTQKRRHRQRELDNTLAQHKAKLNAPEDQDKSPLSDDDLELWQRMFGSEE
ncbi:MAG: hypothetical protein E4H27_07665 [Anaerolineales bacterium]|nr:MAG: hypothetical protein E4H27_07665 [Anaerolineales bacterium]